MLGIYANSFMVATRMDEWKSYGPAPERDRANSWHKVGHAQPTVPAGHEAWRRPATDWVKPSAMG